MGSLIMHLSAVLGAGAARRPACARSIEEKKASGRSNSKWHVLIAQDFSSTKFVYHTKTMPASLPPPQSLLIDADDTLWENNIYFEEAIAGFMRMLNHQEMSHAEVRQFLNQVERETILERGYGSHSFAHSLVTCFEQLAKRPVTPELHEFIWGFAHRVSTCDLELIEGVPETLEYLQGRHHLILLTKGNFTEQSGKVERSGLKEFFTAVEIVAEKDPPTYKAIVGKYRLEPETTWMVGNSPRSDINPALAAGINAVFVPHHNTWVLEHEEMNSAPDGVRLLQVEKFRKLREHF
jgi:putative hydrolase of the HAD superfamily